MIRLKDGFIKSLSAHVALKVKVVLEIGCGTGVRSVMMAKKGALVTAIEPNGNDLKVAKEQNAMDAIVYKKGQAQKLDFPSKHFDVVVFTLSLHHVPFAKMQKAIQEGIRVLKPGGYIVFFEPMFKGALFDTESLFGTYDGDERREKAYAYYSILEHTKKLKPIAELFDITVLKFDSYKDFCDTLLPTKKGKGLRNFLKKHKYTLDAERRMNIFQK